MTKNNNTKAFNLDSNEFDTYLNDIIHNWSKVLTTLGYTLVPTFFILDYFTMPSELLPRFGIYRLISTIAVLIPLNYTHAKIFSRQIN
jgi:hypothetical protein